MERYFEVSELMRIPTIETPNLPAKIDWLAHVELLPARFTLIASILPINFFLIFPSIDQAHFRRFITRNRILKFQKMWFTYLKMFSKYKYKIIWKQIFLYFKSFKMIQKEVCERKMRRHTNHHKFQCSYLVFTWFSRKRALKWHNWLPGNFNAKCILMSKLTFVR